MKTATAVKARKCWGGGYYLGIEWELDPPIQDKTAVSTGAVISHTFETHAAELRARGYTPRWAKDVEMLEPWDTPCSE